MKEINYADIFIRIWSDRKLVIKYVIIFTLLGFLIAIALPKKYTVTTITIPQLGNTQNLKLGNLSSLASMAGIDLSSLSTSEVISPLIYPKVVESLPFQLDLMKSKFFLPRAEKEITLLEYYKYFKKKSIFGIIAEYTFGLPSKILDLLKKSEKEIIAIKQRDSILVINKEIDEIKKHFEKDISIEVNAKFGYVSVSATYDDPLFTALIVQRINQLLQEYITKYKIERASAKLKFITERYLEKKKEFEIAQNRLALFRDRNKNIQTAIVKAEEERLLAEYNLAFSVYNELANQLEQAQIAVKEDTPVFTVIEPAQVPYKKSAPRRFFIIFLFAFLGGITATAYIFYKILDIKVYKSE